MGGGVRRMGGGAGGKARDREAVRVSKDGSACAALGADDGAFRPAVCGDGRGVAGGSSRDDLRGVLSWEFVDAEFCVGVKGKMKIRLAMNLSDFIDRKSVV